MNLKTSIWHFLRKPEQEDTQCLTMTSLKTWCFLPITALLLLSVVPTATEVMMSMSDCAEFFLNGTPPQVPGVLEGGNIQDQNRYKTICQTFNNTRRFVTLYDTKNRIPVFSAAKFRGGGTKRPETPWKIEPQLEKKDGDRNMIDGDRNKPYKYQAGDIDYRNQKPQKFDRGHLFPSSYGYAETDRNSTFTLTNIVPQVHTFNDGSWRKMESCIRCVMDKYCKSNNNIEGFVVIGAQPSTNNLLKNRVNIPSMLWSAFCCQSENEWLASAHWGNNEEPEGKYLHTKTLSELEKELSTPTSVFKVFPGTQCPLHTTVSRFYPNLNANCNCPPQSSTPSASTSILCPFLTPMFIIMFIHILYVFLLTAD